MASKTWDDEMKKLVSEQQQAIRQLGARIDSLKQHQLTALERLEARAEELNARRDDPVVVYPRRHAGAAPKYHSSTSPCGLAGRIDYPAKVLLGDAVAMGIKACSFCGPPAVSAPSTAV